MDFLSNNLQVATLFGIAGLAGLAYNSRKQISYIVSLEYTYNTIMNSKNNKWYNKIQIPNKNDKEIGNLYLGALPIISPINILDELSNLDITIVLSTLEDFEMNLGTSSIGAIGNHIVPANTDTIINYAMKHKLIETPDFTGVPAPIIDEAVDFIHQKLNQHENIYLHCKAGRGRSATVVICYLVKYYGLSLNDAMQLVKSCREQININSHQMKAIKKYINEYVC